MDEFTETNIDLGSKLLDVQRDITRELETKKRLLQELGSMDEDIAKAAYAQMAKNSSYNGRLHKLHANNLSSRLRQIESLGSSETKGIKEVIESRKEEIQMIRDLNRETKILWDMQIKKLEEIKKQRKFINGSLQTTIGLQLKELENFETTQEQLSSIFPKMQKQTVAVLSAVLVLAKFARGMYDDFEKAAWNFRRSTGMIRESAKELRRMAENITIEFTHLNFKIEETYKAISTLGVAMGSVHNVSKDAVKTVGVFAAQLGVAEDNTVGAMRAMALVSRTTIQSQKYSAYFAADLAAAAGVPLNEVMRDVAEMSGVTYSMISKTPLAIMKAAIEARRMNTTINDIARANASILDFQNSVNAEMEASVLLGESINLQQARYLAYNGKITESNKEILRLAQQHGFQTKMDYFQREAFAKASGRSVEELMKQLQAEEEMAAARRSGEKSVQVALQKYEKLKAINEATAKSSGQNHEAMLLQRANQERIVSIQNQWNKLLMQASQIFLPIIDNALILSGALMSAVQGLFSLAVPFKMIGYLTEGIALGLKSIKTISNSIIGPIAIAAKWFGSVANNIITVGGSVAKIGSKIAGWIGPLMKFIGPFTKFLGPIGWVITAFQLISSIWKNFDMSAPWFGLDKVIDEVLLDPFRKAADWIMSFFGGNSPSKLGLSIVNGITSISGMMLNALTYPWRMLFPWIVDPFMKAWDWIKEIFVGNSPSQLSLGILNGIKSASAMMFDALTYPWRMFFAWVLEKIPFMGGFAKTLRGGFGGAITPDVEKQSAAYVPDANIKSKPTESGVVSQKSNPDPVAQSEKQDSSNEVLGAILTAIQTLNKNLESGKIGVYVDGQLMSATIARQTAFKGGYGMNVV